MVTVIFFLVQFRFAYTNVATIQLWLSPSSAKNNGWVPIFGSVGFRIATLATSCSTSWARTNHLPEAETKKKKKKRSHWKKEKENAWKVEGKSLLTFQQMLCVCSICSRCWQPVGYTWIYLAVTRYVNGVSGKAFHFMQRSNVLVPF